MAGLVETGQVGKREDLADIVATVDRKRTPFTSMARKGKTPGNMLMQWQVDALESPVLTGVADATPVTTVENASRNRAVVSGHCMWVRRTAGVGKIAQTVSNVAGVPDEMGSAVTKKLKELARDIEAICCSDGEAQAEESTAKPYLTRGLGKWIQATAQAYLPVPAAARPPSGSIDTTATASLTEALFKGVLQSQWDVTGDAGRLVLICGSSLKKAITNFTQFAGGTDNKAALSVRTYNQELSSKMIIDSVTVYDGDFGRVSIVPTTFNAADSAAAYQKARGYLLDMDQVEIRYAQMPKVTPLPEDGGSTRKMVDAIFGLVVLNPLGLGKFAATS